MMFHSPSRYYNLGFHLLLMHERRRDRRYVIIASVSYVMHGERKQLSVNVTFQVYSLVIASIRSVQWIVRGLYVLAIDLYVSRS